MKNCATLEPLRSRYKERIKYDNILLEKKSHYEKKIESEPEKTRKIVGG